MTSIIVNGAADVLNNLRNFKQKEIVKIAKKGVGAGAAVIRKAIKESALSIDDKATGRQIADNVTSRASRSQKGIAAAKVGIARTKGGKIKKGNPDLGRRTDTPHWHMVEFGTEHSRAEPFARPAITANAQKALDSAVAKMKLEIEK